ncbi:MAG: DNA polymerase IV [Tissierellia bacterium]|jgi:DNA polymerase-4|nr:DNA polymerase IV [Bacillota bacterium]NLK59116.1 DNA polymerase IV [Tissierellia bacterium]
MHRKIFHIDVNSAYLSWEAAWRLQHGETLDLRDIPSIVGGDVKKRRGIVLAKSIPAKAYGIQTGETVYSAVQKCPSLISVAPQYERYVVASDSMVALIREYSPYVQRYSVDEVFLDYQGKRDPLDVAEEIRERIKTTLGFTVNIGVGENKLLAKVASDFTKPDRVHTLYREEIKRKMWPLPVEDLFMVGRRTKKKLNDRGIWTIGDLAALDRDYILHWLKKPGLTIWEYANGIENSPVKNEGPPPKSVGNSTTTAFDVETEEDALLVLLGLTETVCMRLRAHRMYTRLVNVHFRNYSFVGYGRERTLYSATDSTARIYSMVKTLFRELWEGEPLRQLGVSVGRLSPNDVTQLSFFETWDEEAVQLDRTVDQVRNKYGQTALYRSSFLDSGIHPVIGGVIAEEDYPMMASLL